MILHAEGHSFFGFNAALLLWIYYKKQRPLRTKMRQ